MIAHDEIAIIRDYRVRIRAHIAVRLGEMGNKVIKCYLSTRSRIDLANCTLSLITDVNLGDGLLMSSRDNLTAAMMAAAMTTVDANLSCFRRSSSSRAIALRISPMSAKPLL